ncbi:hypothetical protein D6T63_04205 [Arthrobacter cheniae]|uniref:Uncharacterized protein n=1 Tax=Arthrobacter cheniae TaxID=1258888 RepID=A0A3A5M6Y6_9MICC|nr:heparin lyase I family protein [Arthrobacter cheniae]RJT81957.1 hypothetical protein D6T63_04205 [Arthrobacter cheniae]
MLEVFYEGVVAGNSANVDADDSVSEFIAAPGAEFQVFELGDISKTNPLPVKVGGRAATTIKTSDRSVMPDVRVTSDSYAHIFKSGTFEWERLSNDGMKKAVDEARAAAQLVAAEMPARVTAELEAAAAAGTFKGEPGQDGSNVVPTAQAIATEIQTPGTAARVALSATIATETAPKLDKTEALTTYARTLESLYAKSSVLADFVNGDYRLENVRQPDRATVATLTAPTFATSGALQAFQAGANITPNYPFSGGTVGVVGSGGAFPSQWFGHNNSQVKTVVSVAPTSLTFSITPVGGALAAGIRVPIFTPGSDVILSFNCELTHPTAAVDNARLHAGWFNSSTGVLGATVPVSTLNGGKHRATVRLGDPGGAAQVALVVITRNGGVGAEPVILSIGDFMTTATTHARQGEAFIQPPYLVGSWPASTHTLTVPANGEYALLAMTAERGVIARNVTVVGKSLNIASALDGSYTVEKILLVPRAAYVPGDSEVLAPPQFVNIPRFLNSGRALRDQAIGSLQLAATHGETSVLADEKTFYAVQVARNARHRTRFEIRNGDRMPEDGATQRRAELIVGGALPFDVPVWTSFWFRILKPSVSSDAYVLMFQYRYTNDAGDTSGLSPELSLVQYEGNKVHLITRSDPINGSSAQVNPLLVGGSWPNKSTASPSTVVRTGFTFTPGKWHRFVSASTFSKSGGGYLKAWFDGVSYFDAPAAIGYNRAVGPQFHYGTYGGNHPETRQFEYAHMEGGVLADLSGRVTWPEPV